jgi:ribosome biogenesis GTPase / thiamine phosphate phosphatase
LWHSQLNLRCVFSFCSYLLTSIDVNALLALHQANILEMISLEDYGWNFFHSQTPIQQNEHHPGRVISIQGFKYYLITAKGELETELSGKLLYSSDSDELPKVGDWVLYLDYGQTGYVIEVLPRQNSLSRKSPGNRTERQILAANIDYALIVQGLDNNFNLMRIERYITQVEACGIWPVVILNKSDLVEDLEAYKLEVQRLQRSCQFLFCSTKTGQGMAELKGICQKSKTYILIGSSGVGKSSLMNKLMSNELRLTSETSESNNKGRHTTTTRDLFQMPNGSLMIDTPGMREFGLTSEDGNDAGDAFPVIDKLACGCRYNDCKHLNEVGCAVLEALHAGDLDIVIYESYVKLMKEQKRFQVNIIDKKRQEKQFGRMTRQAKNHRKKYKF